MSIYQLICASPTRPIRRPSMYPPLSIQRWFNLSIGPASQQSTINLIYNPCVHPSVYPSINSSIKMNVYITIYTPINYFVGYQGVSFSSSPLLLFYIPLITLQLTDTSARFTTVVNRISSKRTWILPCSTLPKPNLVPHIGILVILVLVRIHGRIWEWQEQLPYLMPPAKEAGVPLQCVVSLVLVKESWG